MGGGGWVADAPQCRVGAPRRCRVSPAIGSPLRRRNGIFSPARLRGPCRRLAEVGRCDVAVRAEAKRRSHTSCCSPAHGYGANDGSDIAVEGRGRTGQAGKEQTRTTFVSGMELDAARGRTFFQFCFGLIGAKGRLAANIHCTSWAPCAVPPRLPGRCSAWYSGSDATSRGYSERGWASLRPFAKKRYSLFVSGLSHPSPPSPPPHRGVATFKRRCGNLDGVHAQGYNDKGGGGGGGCS